MEARMNSVKVLSGTFISNRQRCASLASALVLLLIAVTSAQAQTFSVLHTFTGGRPPKQLVRDAAGNLYGVNVDYVLKLDTAGNLSALGPSNLALNPELVIDPAGNLYGATPQGGLVHCFLTGPGLPIEDVGCGTVFKLDPSGHKTVLYNFSGGNTGPDGAFPNFGLVRDAAGNLYGSTSGGGSNSCFLTGLAMGCGVIFKLDTNGNETMLHNYGRATGLVLDTAGNLYGIDGASVFKLDKAGAFSHLYTFTGGTDGWDPRGDLAIDGAGNLYGTTYTGGLSSCITGGSAIGCGVVFKVDPAGKETVVYTFTGGSADGANPQGGVVLDAAGNLYGTTWQGGAASAGTVFKLDATGKETVLHDFTGGADGGSPNPGLVLDTAGNLYGSAASGGDLSCGAGGCGVIFKIAPTKPDFSLSAAAFSPSTIRAGGSSTSNLSIRAMAGFSGSVTLSCSVQPAPTRAPQCSISPGSVAPGTPATLTVTTTAPTRAFHSSAGSGFFYALWLPLIGCVAIRGCSPKSKQKVPALLLGCVLITGLMLQIACGGGSTISDGGGSSATPAGTYTVTITGTDASGSLQHSTTTTVTVQ
jgi:uncharacterized repeat protein (TIGR03803 family)